MALSFLRGSHHPVAHVRSLVVVEVDNAAYELAGLIQVPRPFHAVQPFLLYYAVDTFRHGVVRGLVILGHGY